MGKAKKMSGLSKGDKQVNVEKRPYCPIHDGDRDLNFGGRKSTPMKLPPYKGGGSPGKE